MMLRRCNDPSHKAYKYYGGRGIKICERWLDFENFYADMGERPEGLSIDRIDNDGDYQPGNCRWATALEQARNKRRKSVFDEDVNVSALARELGLTRQAIYARIKLGWPIARVVREGKHGRSN